jgi:hypothetical protein
MCTIAVSDNYLPTDTIFAYGKIVDDFINVDKSKLGLLALAGVKEVHAIVKEQAIIIITLETQLSQVLQRLAAAGIA